MFSNNGKATIWGAIAASVKDAASQTLNKVTVAVAETAAENVRLEQGKSKFQFYGAMAWEFVKKHWIWFLIPTVLVPVLWLVKKYSKKSKKSW